MPSQFISDSYTQTGNDTIHILGTGAIGCHMAATLKSHQHDVSLLLRTQSSLKEFKSLGSSIVYGLPNQAPQITSGFRASVVDDLTDTSPISSLIVCTKSTDTLQAIRSIAHRVTSQTNIVLLQNGYGVVEELIQHLWPEKAPPTLFVTVNRNCLVREKPFYVCHHSDPSFCSIKIGQYPSRVNPHLTALFLIQSLTSIPELNATMLPWPELLSSLYKKLTLNACVNALAGIVVCDNGKIIMEKNKHGIAVMELVLQETYQVLGPSIIGETYDSLLNMVVNVLHSTKDFTCSTVQDINAKRTTEVDYINGYICKLGLENNINVKTNQTLVQLIHFKEVLYD